MNGLSIWVFDLVQQQMPFGSPLPPTVIAPVLFEDCPPTMSGEAAQARAAWLTLRHGRAFFTRVHGSDGTYEPIAPERVAHEERIVAAAIKAQEARKRMRREERKLAKYGVMH